jgi:hypothetical protein
MSKNQDIQNSESAFNISLSSLERINLILTGCSMSSFKKDLLTWCDNLIVLRKETSTFYIDRENKLDNGDKESEDKNLQQGYKERLKQYILYLRGMGNDQKKALYTNTALINKFWEIHDFLEEYEGFLRNVLHRKGLLLKMEKDPTKASIDL